MPEGLDEHLSLDSRRGLPQELLKVLNSSAELSDRFRGLANEDQKEVAHQFVTLKDLVPNEIERFTAALTQVESYAKPKAKSASAGS